MKGRMLFPITSRRGQDRFTCALAVSWNHGGNSELGYATNLSPEGFCLRTRQIHEPGFAHTFHISCDEGEVTVGARVLWTRQLQVESHVNAWHEMGLTLDGTSQSDYLQLLNRVQTPPDERRIHRRFAHSMVVKVRGPRGEFRAHSVDVSKQGVLFLSDTLPETGTTIDMEMRMSGTAASVKLKAQVVRVISTEAHNKVNGFAVRFLGFSKEEEKTFINYLKIVRELHDITAPI